VDASSSPARSAPARRSRAGGLLWLLLAAIALSAAGWYGWQHWRTQQAHMAAQAAQLRDAERARIEALRRAQQAQAQRLQQAEATNRVLRDELLGIGQRAALLEDSVSKLAGPDRHGAQSLRLDEIELLLGIGQQRMQLADDLDGARRALALAAPLLAGIDDPAYLNLRQTLAQEQAAMDALGADPRVRAQALLDALIAGVRSAPPASAATDMRAPWYERLLERVVRVQPTAGAGLGQVPDREAALAALQIEASLARAAIERRDDAALASALARIDGWLQRLLAGSPALAQKRRVAAALKATPLRTASPLSGSTLQQLRALRGQ
jgi:uroporphyrin-3 C-methyltransferase